MGGVDLSQRIRLTSINRLTARILGEGSGEGDIYERTERNALLNTPIYTVIDRWRQLEKLDAR